MSLTKGKHKILSLEKKRTVETLRDLKNFLTVKDDFLNFII